MSMVQRSGSPVRRSVPANFCEKCKIKTMGKLQFPCGRVVVLCEKCALKFFDVLVLKSSSKKVVWDATAASDWSTPRAKEEAAQRESQLVRLNLLKQQLQEAAVPVASRVKVPETLKSSYQKNLSSVIHPSKSSGRSQPANIGKSEDSSGKREAFIPSLLARVRKKELEIRTEAFVFQRTSPAQGTFGVPAMMSQRLLSDVQQNGRSAERDRKQGAAGNLVIRVPCWVQQLNMEAGCESKGLEAIVGREQLERQD
eukprot:692165-Hanusia_phi.AAC.8